MIYNLSTITIKELLDYKKYLTNIDMQREYIYKDGQARYLLDSIQKNIPTPAIYLWKNKNNTFEVLDGKQRITAIRLYKNPSYLQDSIHNLFLMIDNMDEDDFLSYKIPVIICSGTEQEKVETFKRINTTAIPLKEFEILSALYQGKFSKEFGNWGMNLSDSEIKFFGSGIRGENCIKALELFTKNNEEYFKHNRDKSFINGLKKNIDKLVSDILDIFSNYGMDWYILAKIVLENSKKVGTWKRNKIKIVELFNLYRNNGELSVSPSKESFYKEILGCYDITGLDSKRFFTKMDKQTLYMDLKTGSRGKKICPDCEKEFSFDDFEIDHKNPWSKGGQTLLSNAQLLCINCNKKKGAKT
jgi:hypothetical protein